MPVLPVPMMIVLLLAAFLVQRMVRGGTHVSLLLLIAVCAVQSAVIALVQYYGVAPLRPLQPVLATVIPPVAWFAFTWAAGGQVSRWPMLWHAAGPLLAIAALVFRPELLDLLIPLSFAGYGLVMLLRLRDGEDALPHSRLENGSRALAAWRIVALALVASAACDVLIAYGLARGMTGFVVWLPSVVSSLSLLALGALSLSHAIESRREGENAEAVPSDEEIARDKTILAQLDEHVARHKPYLDPDLTLARLARRLVLPAKQLSAAINRGRNENVSRYINRLRIEEACRILAEGKSVTTAMLDSGFNTKSNFNREFLRVKHKSPSQWQAENQ